MDWVLIYYFIFILKFYKYLSNSVPRSIHFPRIDKRFSK
ncbi:hypothetical protein LEP1GSC193_2897 [Leptospira alstonii serovar Pingchang str. 80-412]|uniref:Uncharacterized protein n=2 Tax=Leptospira alstonii TaxID=28452 RepID=M6D122_9LEPT|nr:hypothetical protein LEP1GSC194_3267 [Leptospira alstonii serovar Sichuan str. 79601]EQA81654.1 hypothetical protein LEP1GSC193_2897 [Leptospira alstonii serovar Pingchang str. 80-412]